MFHIILMCTLARAINTSYMSFISIMLLIFLDFLMYSLSFGYCEDANIFCFHCSCSILWHVSKHDYHGPLKFHFMFCSVDFKISHVFTNIWIPRRLVSSCCHFPYGFGALMPRYDQHMSYNVHWILASYVFIIFLVFTNLQIQWRFFLSFFDI